MNVSIHIPLNRISGTHMHIIYPIFVLHVHVLSKVLNSPYSIHPLSSSSISFISYSMSIVISKSFFIMFINFYASTNPSLSSYPPIATYAKSVSSSLSLLCFRFIDFTNSKNWSSLISLF